MKTTKAYYARMKDSLEAGKNIEAVKKTVLGVEIGIDKEKTIEKLKTFLIAENPQEIKLKTVKIAITKYSLSSPL